MTQQATRKDYYTEVKAAVEKLRGYAAEHSDDILSAIDKVGDVIDKNTGHKFAGKVDKAQRFAKDRVGGLKANSTAEASGAASDAPAADPFSLDDEHTTWKQPPGTPGAAHATSGGAAGKPSVTKEDLAKAMATLREYAASHADDITGLVDKVGDFVDKQTKGKYAERIDKAQAAAKQQVGKLKNT